MARVRAKGCAKCKKDLQRKLLMHSLRNQCVCVASPGRCPVHNAETVRENGTPRPIAL